MEKYYIITREFILWGVCIAYTLSFVSLFGQIPGLYGENGILPANAAFKKSDLISKFGHNGPISVDLLCLCGMIMGFAGVVTADQRNKILFILLWIVHLSILQIGQVFVQNVGDSLLTKIGFLAMLMAPCDFCGILKGRGEKENLNKINSFEFFISLGRWLLFKIHFAPAFYRLLTNFPDIDFMNEVLPNPITWFLMQSPDWLTSFLSSQSEIVSLFIAFTAIIPFKQLQRTGFVAQLLLSIYKYIVGENGLVALLQFILSFTLLDDNYFKDKCEDTNDTKNQKSQWDISLKNEFIIFAFLTIVLAIFKEKINISQTAIIKMIIGVSIFAAIIIVLSLVYQLVNILKRSLDKLNSILSLLAYTSSILLILFSLVPVLNMDADAGAMLPKQLTSLYLKATNQLKLFNDFSSFERESSNRYEIVLETSDQLDEGWVELKFKYKKSTTNQRPPFALTHSPKLDMQMHYAAKTNYKRNHWILNFAHKILTNQKEVKYLLGDNPHLSKAPKYVRACLFKYQFSSLHKNSPSYSKSDWWIREKVGDYLPILSSDDPGLLQYIRAAKLQEEEQSVSYIASFKLYLGNQISNGCHFGIFLIILGILVTSADPATNLTAFWRFFKNAATTQLTNGEKVIRK